MNNKELTELDYDPKSQTISDLRGGRIKINISDDNDRTELVNNELAHKSEIKRIKLLNDKIKEAVANKKYKDIANYRGELTQLISNINKRKKDPYSSTVLQKSQYLNTSMDDIKNSPMAIKHEEGHKNTIDKRRIYVKQTGGINPDTGTMYPNIDTSGSTPKRIIKQIKLSPNELQDLKKSNFNLYKKYMKADKEERENIARKVKEDNLDPKIKDYINTERKSKKMKVIAFNKHDTQPEEIQADAFSLHHTKKDAKNAFKNSLKNVHKKANKDTFDSETKNMERNQRYQNAKKVHDQSDGKAYEKVIEELFHRYHNGQYTAEATLELFDLICEKYLN